MVSAVDELQHTNPRSLSQPPEPKRLVQSCILHVLCCQQECIQCACPALEPLDVIEHSLVPRLFVQLFFTRSKIRPLILLRAKKSWTESLGTRLIEHAVMARFCFGTECIMNVVICTSNLGGIWGAVKS